jgi:2-C-methyl-D-erythritol 4-phosphate cytidylyltransferase
MTVQCSSSARATALIVAAGSGSRLGADRPKAFVDLAGRTLLEWSVRALAASPSIGEIVVALPEGSLAPPNTIGVAGGRIRSESVRNALDAASEAEIVLVHDAARPLVTPELVERVIAALAAPGVDAAIAATPVTDTIKCVQAAATAARGSLPESSHLVLETLPREDLWAVQTPQAFRWDALRKALNVPVEILARASDDAWLVERYGGDVAIVSSGAENLKVTTPLDLELAALLLRRRED